MQLNPPKVNKDNTMNILLIEVELETLNSLKSFNPPPISVKEHKIPRRKSLL